MFASEHKHTDGSARRIGYEALRAGVAAAAAAYLPGWGGRLTPHVLRHFVPAL